MEVIHLCCAGFDVHRDTVVVCLRRATAGGQVQKVVRTYRTDTRDLSTLVRWLLNEGVTHVAMESTGVFWKPIYNILEEQGKFEILLCNAHHVKQVPGRKTDVKDCEWIAQLLQHGLLRGSFVPRKPIREMRDLTRHRAKITDQHTAVANRIHKVLQDANIKLSSVASDVLGASGRAMIESMIAGETDPKKLAELARKQLRGKIPQLEVALEGRIREHHRFELTFLYDHLQYLEKLLATLNARIAEVMKKDSESVPPIPPPPAEAGPLFAALPPPPKDPSIEGKKPELPFETAILLLCTIPGIQRLTAENILVEIGTNMSQFPSAKHLASWAGVSPGNNESAGKKLHGRARKGNRWLRRALSQAAWAAAHTKATYFSAAFGRWAARRGKKRAVVAVAHALLAVIYVLLKSSKTYAELGPNHFDRIDPEQQARYHLRRLEALGYKATIEKGAA